MGEVLFIYITSCAIVLQAVEQRDKKIEELKTKLEDAATNFEMNESLIVDVRNELMKGVYLRCKPHILVKLNAFMYYTYMYNIL